MIFIVCAKYEKFLSVNRMVTLALIFHSEVISWYSNSTSMIFLPLCVNYRQTDVNSVNIPGFYNSMNYSYFNNCWMMRKGKYDSA